jgi:predicted AlkP superfamily pyrophosphatase or phosphodiesterase
MKKNNKVMFFLMLLGIFLVQRTVLGYVHRPPRLTVVFVVDQCAHSYFDKLAPYFKHGLKHLIENGVVYSNAHMPHGQPGTATGHTGLNTGVCAKDHGIFCNSWFADGKKVACDDDNSGNAQVFSPDGTYEYGKSAHRIMVDGLSDQCVLHSEPRSTFAVYGISLKSRAAIGTVGRLGKPLWIDDATGLFTSSKAYFDQLPEWVNKFNTELLSTHGNTVFWQRMYQKSPYAYDFFNTNNYKYARSHETMLDRPLPVWDPSHPKKPGYLFEKTPFANQMLLDCAQECIKMHVSRKHKNRLMLWVCLSPLDKCIHQFGPDSIEAIDMMYHLDKQLQKFIRGVYRTIGKHEVAFALTADHGIMPIPELLHDQGLTLARRIDSSTFIERINTSIEKTFGMGNLIVGYKSQDLFLDTSKLKDVAHEKHQSILGHIKSNLSEESGIKNIWTLDEIERLYTQPNTIEDNIKNQVFRGRSGSLIIQPYPYTMITEFPQGTSHKTPYNYDTHVPLIIFHPGRFERRVVRQRVVALQLANTLAELLCVQKPSASTYEILPELFDPEYK